LVACVSYPERSPSQRRRLCYRMQRVQRMQRFSRGREAARDRQKEGKEEK